VPSFIAPGDARGTERNAPDAWDGPAADALLERARRQPGARGRAGGSVKFQCAACRDEGHDRSRDNARVFPTGRWGCAVNREHRRAIAVQLGVTAARLPATEADALSQPYTAEDERADRALVLPYTEEEEAADRAARIPLSPDDPEWAKYGPKRKKRT
jgi:hypothetical protein